ncbi:hypothetical protein CLV84_0664 [Neolewinella xylanilytica]|uniref:Uncharacterized protein n=1 Tax=Neolewinella xylanilytica TaxID=1514080 RepID=A0A2S6I889_9BACT|nr:hypothetical protein [Neolewinella xylanilytica]PPK87714.1 hypothetical protein CLV84_0664 [Neolewinella xylanilytica]
MNVFPVMLLAGLFGFYLGISGCEQPAGAVEVCARQVTERLGLVEDPQPPCSLSVVIYQTAEETIYTVNSATCYTQTRYYACTGERLPFEPDEARRVIGAATDQQLLGFIPGDRYCAERIISRLGLVAEPQSSCATFVEVLLRDERYFFRYASPNCQLVAVPFDCDGDPVCEETDTDCLAEWLQRAEPAENIGYLPE